MQEKFHTRFNDFTFIVKTPGESKCEIVKKDVVLLHSGKVDYSEIFKEFKGSLFCSSLDSDFSYIVELYKGPISFDCVAIDREDVNFRSLQWLKEEILKEFTSRFPEEIFYDLFFI